MELAAQGSSSSVDTYVQDLKGGGKDDFYGLFPDDVYCFSFGKACGKDRGNIKKNLFYYFYCLIVLLLLWVDMFLQNIEIPLQILKLLFYFYQSW